MTSGGEVFFRLYGQRLGLVAGCGFFFGFGGVVLERGWMVEGILLGLLCCRTNDAMNIFLLPAIVHAREGKEKGRLWRLVS